MTETFFVHHRLPCTMATVSSRQQPYVLSTDSVGMVQSRNVMNSLSLSTRSLSQPTNELQTKSSGNFSIATRKSSGPIDLDDDIGSYSDSDDDEKVGQQYEDYRCHGVADIGWHESSGGKVEYKTDRTSSVIEPETRSGPIDLDEFSFADSEVSEIEPKIIMNECQVEENYLMGWSESLSGLVSTPTRSNHTRQGELSNRFQTHELREDIEKHSIYANTPAISNEVHQTICPQTQSFEMGVVAPLTLSASSLSNQKPIPKLRQCKRDTPSIHKTRNLVKYAETRTASSKNTSNCTDATSTISSPSPSRHVNGGEALVTSPNQEVHRSWVDVTLTSRTDEMWMLPGSSLSHSTAERQVEHDDPPVTIDLSHDSQDHCMESRSMDSSQNSQKEINNTTYESKDDSTYKYQVLSSPINESFQNHSRDSISVKSLKMIRPPHYYLSNQSPLSTTNAQEAQSIITPDRSTRFESTRSTLSTTNAQLAQSIVTPDRSTEFESIWSPLSATNAKEAKSIDTPDRLARFESTQSPYSTTNAQEMLPIITPDRSIKFESTQSPMSAITAHEALPSMTPDPPLMQTRQHRHGMPDSPNTDHRPRNDGSQRSQRTAADIAHFMVVQNHGDVQGEYKISNDWEIQSASAEWKSILFKTGVPESVNSQRITSNGSSDSNVKNEEKVERDREGSRTKTVGPASPGMKKNSRDNKYSTMMYKQEYNKCDNQGRLGIRNMFSYDDDDKNGDIIASQSCTSPDRTSPHLRDIANLSPIVDHENEYGHTIEDLGDELHNLSYDSAIRRSNINEIIMGSDAEYEEHPSSYDEATSDAYGPTMEERGASSFLRRLQACVSPVVYPPKEVSEHDTVDGTAASASTVHSAAASIHSTAASILSSQHLAFLRSQVSAKSRRFMPPSFCGHPDNVHDEDIEANGIANSQNLPQGKPYATTAISGPGLQSSASIVDKNLASIQNVGSEGTVTTHNRSSVASSRDQSSRKKPHVDPHSNNQSNNLVRARAKMYDSFAKQMYASNADAGFVIPPKKQMYASNVDGVIRISPPKQMHASNVDAVSGISSTKNQQQAWSPQRVASYSTGSSSGDSSCDDKNISRSTMSSSNFGYRNDEQLNNSGELSV